MVDCTIRMQDISDTDYLNAQNIRIRTTGGVTLTFVKRPGGEWKRWHPKGYKCSKCNRLAPLPYNFCPYCGVDNRGETT